MGLIKIWNPDNSQSIFVCSVDDWDTVLVVLNISGKYITYTQPQMLEPEKLMMSKFMAYNSKDRNSSCGRGRREFIRDDYSRIVYMR
jgi:hypothetical protein